MNDPSLHTRRLDLVPKTLAEVRGEIDEMSSDQRTQLSAACLARLDDPAVDEWTLGFAIVDHTTATVVGGCGFKGPPDQAGTVEIAYGIAPEYRGQGYAAEAAAALVAFAFGDRHVQIVRAHTFADDNASARVLTKCGFRRLGQVVDPDDGVVWRWETLRR